LHDGLHLLDRRAPGDVDDESLKPLLPPEVALCRVAVED